MDEIKISSNRSFGIVFFGVFLLVSFYPLINHENIRYWSLFVSLILQFLIFLLIFRLLGTIEHIMLHEENDVEYNRYDGEHKFDYIETSVASTAEYRLASNG